MMAKLVAGIFARGSMLNKLKGIKGLTFVELMVVVALIGILTAIAIPQFTYYRQRAYNSAAQSDLKNVRTGFESYYAENRKYP